MATGFHFGEWLEPDSPPNPDPSRDHGIVATAHLFRSATPLARAAAVAGSFFYAHVAGIRLPDTPDPNRPGYGAVTIAPRPGGGIT